MKDNSRSRILIIDDSPGVIEFLDGVLSPDYDLSFATSGIEGVALAQSYPADIILLDVMMPELDGYDVCRQLRELRMTRDTPIVFLTSLASPHDEEFGLSLGADDFIAKPISPPVLRARVKNHLLFAQSQRALKRQNEELEILVFERTKEVMRRDHKLIAAQTSIITAFCALAEARDHETGNHIQRTQNYVKILAERLRWNRRFSAVLNDDYINVLYKSAPLHDVGKVSVPDAILLKPGGLLPAEWEIMQRHCAAGSRAIARAAQDYGEAEDSFFEVAAEIAMFHHERWDGSGYPQGLAGDEIPVSARLMAVADVYDALISPRIYKRAFSQDKAIELMVEQRGRHFDPDILDAMLEISDRFSDIARHFSDPLEREHSPHQERVAI
ncbi:HD domain-containing phosphohydrolase [Propionivibrio dicarboxylicus]|uniref:Putative two-component system response regulator n=1 Tax=Propionivibrio dicarboxylicus TaxID=83767 RepID=A0A1G7ZTN6_9RHOO|nr:HD domain-containing phosphohydrolase [Propionivibrio dicarboxylicus]SDH12065.1 putative two-component system response regulator [Propionivibrio dicarboxylicus]